MIGSVLTNHDKNKLKEYMVSQSMASSIEKVKASMDRYYNVMLALYDVKQEILIEININDNGWVIQCFNIEWDKEKVRNEEILDKAQSSEIFIRFVGESTEEFKVRYEEIVVNGNIPKEIENNIDCSYGQVSSNKTTMNDLQNENQLPSQMDMCSCCGGHGSEIEGVVVETKSSNKRVSKDNYYLDITQTVGKRGTCLRRNYGAIIVKNDEIIATGYTGAPRGRKNCSDLGYCRREQLNIPRGTQYELCRSVHAEANTIISSSRREMLGSTLYLVGQEARTNELVQNANSCSMCKRLIINAGIEKVVIRDTDTKYRVINVQDWIDNDDSLSDEIGY